MVYASPSENAGGETIAGDMTSKWLVCASPSRNAREQTVAGDMTSKTTLYALHESYHGPHGRLQSCMPFHESFHGPHGILRTT